MFINHFLCFTFVVITQHNEARVCHTNVYKYVNSVQSKLSSHPQSHWQKQCKVAKCVTCWRATTVKYIKSTSSSGFIKHTAFVLYAFYTTACNILWCLKREAVTNMLSPVDSIQFLHPSKWHTLCISSTTVHNSMHTHGGTLPLRSTHMVMIIHDFLFA